MSLFPVPNYSREKLELIWNQVPPDYYQKGVATHRLQRLWHTNKAKIISRLIAGTRPKPKKILDVGSASGWFLSELQKYFPEASCHGVDVYKAAITYGQRTYPQLHLKLSDAHTIPYPDKSFDVVVCCEVLEHVLDPEQVIREIKRVLTPDGTAVIEMDTGNWLFRIVWHWWTNMRRGAWHDAHLHLFTKRKLERLIRESGFAIQKTVVFNWSMAVAFLITKQ